MPSQLLFAASDIRAPPFAVLLTFATKVRPRERTNPPRANFASQTYSLT